MAPGIKFTRRAPLAHRHSPHPAPCSPLPVRRRRGHSLIELIAAMIAAAVLVAGLASVMMIARHTAYTPTAAHYRTRAAQAIDSLADELRYATLILAPSANTLEFVVADRTDPADGRAEKIRYQWSGTAGQPLERILNGGTPIPVLKHVENCVFTYQSAGSPAAISRVNVQLLAGKRDPSNTPLPTHSRIDAAIPMISQPVHLSAYWRLDFDTPPAPLPATVDADANGSFGGNFDWVATGGASFVANADAVHSPGELSEGTWYANGDLSSNPASNFDRLTIVEVRCKNMNTNTTSPANIADVLRINADQQLLTIRMQRQLDGSQTLTLFRKPASGADEVLKVVDNLADDVVRFRMTIVPGTRQVTLQINDIGTDVLGGPFTYSNSSPTSTDRCVKIGGGAKFDYIDVRVGTN